jgi:aminopeptidase N
MLLQDVALLRASQFSEDAGPMAHPIRPDSYIKMDNFYTVTVYEKVRLTQHRQYNALQQEGAAHAVHPCARFLSCHACCVAFIAASSSSGSQQYAHSI